MRAHSSLKLLIPIFTLVFLAGCAAVKPNINIPTTPPPSLKLPAQPRVALAFGGGGARGMAHIGVLKVLQREHIPIDLIVGCSAGSIVGALYADNPNAPRIEKILTHTSATDLIDFSPSIQGPATGYALQDFLLKHMQAKNFSGLKIPFIAVTSDLMSGETIPLSSGPIAPAVNASAALPPVFRPVSLYGRTLVDGGVTDLVPVDIAKKYHPQIIIAVSIVPNLPKKMPKSVLEVYDRAYDLLDARFSAYNTKDADIRLHPYVGQTGTFDGSSKPALIRAGELATERALPQICALLKEKNIPSNCS